MLHLALINEQLFQVAEGSENVILSITEAQFAQAGYSWSKRYTYKNGVLTEIVVLPPVPSLEDVKQAKLLQLDASLYDIFESGYLSLYRAHETNQAQYARNLQLINEAVAGGVMQETDTVQWFGKQGVQSGTVVQYRQFIINYGFWVQAKMTAYYSAGIAINEAQTVEEVNAINIQL